MKKKWILAEIVFALVGLAACGDGEISKLTGEDESRYYLQDADYYANLMSSAMEACKNDPACAGKIGDIKSSSSSEMPGSSATEPGLSSVALSSSSSAMSSSAKSSSSEKLSSSSAGLSSSSVESSSSAELSSSSAVLSSSSKESSSSEESSSSAESSGSVPESSSSEILSSSSAVSSSSEKLSSSSAELSSSSAVLSSSSKESSSSEESSSSAESSSSVAESSSSEEASSSSGSEIVYTDKTLEYGKAEVEIPAGAYHVYSTNRWSGVLRCRADVETEVLVDGKSVTIGTYLNSVDGANPRTEIYVALIVPENTSIFCKIEW